MKLHEKYVCAILSNPEWIKAVCHRYGNGTSVGAPELATAVFNLDSSLAQRFDVDEDASEDEVVAMGGSEEDSGS